MRSTWIWYLKKIIVQEKRFYFICHRVLCLQENSSWRIRWISSNHLWNKWSFSIQLKSRKWKNKYDFEKNKLKFIVDKFRAKITKYERKRKERRERRKKEEKSKSTTWFLSSLVNDRKKKKSKLSVSVSLSLYMSLHVAINTLPSVVQGLTMSESRG